MLLTSLPFDHKTIIEIGDRRRRTTPATPSARRVRRTTGQDENDKS